jgi:pyridoxine kinase
MRVLAINDISCVGKCSLTVALPIISACGVECSVLPTTILSTHTGGFTGYTFHDLTDEIPAILKHWETLGLKFDYICSGYLGSISQIELVLEIKKRFLADGGKFIVDPVMGDDGVLYATYTQELADGMRELGTHADVLTPNLTEACFLTDTPYIDTVTLSEGEAEGYVLALLEKLSYICHGKIVVTGIGLAGGIVANAGRDGDGRIFWVKRTCQDISYPGTGDIFASVLLGALMQGDSFEVACTRAADFIVLLIGESAKIDTPVRMGVALEPYLGALLKN